MRRLKSRLGLIVCSLFFLSSASHAATTVTGQISSSIILLPGCLVNGASGSTGLNFGSLNFGTIGLLSNEGDAQVLSGGGPMFIQCSTGVVPVLKMRSGLHDGRAQAGTRALSNGAGNFIAYDLYVDPGSSMLLAIDGTITLATSTGTGQALILYGKLADTAGAPAGTYTDSISVELTF